MWLFKPKKEASTSISVIPPAESRVEIELHKGATEQAAAKADEVNQHVKDLLVNNGFTLKIYLAAGGRQPKSNKGIH